MMLRVSSQDRRPGSKAAANRIAKVIANRNRTEVRLGRICRWMWNSCHRPESCQLECLLPGAVLNTCVFCLSRQFHRAINLTVTPGTGMKSSYLANVSLVPARGSL